MADNTQVNTMTGGDVISTDDLGTVKVQRVKVQYGVDGTATDVAAGTPLPVTNSGTQAVSAASLPLPTGAATSAQMSDGSQKTQIVDPGGVNTATVNGSGALSIAGTVNALVGSATGSAIPATALPVGANNAGNLVGLTADASGRLRVDLSGTSANATAIKVDGSAVTQPVSGTVSTGLTQPLTDTQLRASAVPVSGTVAISNPTTNPETGLAKDATLTGGTTKAIARGGAKGTTVAADLTSNPIDANTQALHVDGSKVTQPVSIASMPSTPVTGTFWQATQPVSDAGSSITVDAPVGTPVNVRLSDGAANITTLPVSLATNTPTLQSGSTTAVTQATGTNLHTVVDSGTITTVSAVTGITNALPAGTNLLGKVSIDQTTPGTTNNVAVTPPTLTKATQGSTGFSVQPLKDAGRSSVMVSASVASTATAETLITLSKSTGLAAVTTASSNTITTGKRFRIQTITASVRNSTGTTAGLFTLKLRAAVAGATTTASPLQYTCSVALPAAATSVSFPTINIPDGFEIDSNSATNTWGITITHPQWVTASVVATVDLSIVGFEY